MNKKEQIKWLEERGFRSVNYSSSSETWQRMYIHKTYQSEAPEDEYLCSVQAEVTSTASGWLALVRISVTLYIDGVRLEDARISYKTRSPYTTPQEALKECFMELPDKYQNPVIKDELECCPLLYDVNEYLNKEKNDE
jgi:hypothetical protein